MAELKSGITLLNGTNFPTWKIQCKMALMKEDTWSIVCGEEEAPDNADALVKFNKRRNRALSTIVLSVKDSLLFLLGEPEDPTEVWKKLSNQFQKKSWSNKLALRRKLYAMKLRNDGCVQEHIKGMMELFDELAVIGDPIEEEDRVVHLLASLPESFDMLVTALEANSEVPTLENVTERLLHEERKLKDKISESGGADGKALMAGKYNARYNNNNNIGNRNKPCWNCGKTGHLQRECEEPPKEKGKAFSQTNNKDKGGRIKRKETAYVSQEQFQKQQQLLEKLQLEQKQQKQRIQFQGDSSSDEYEQGMIVVAPPEKNETHKESGIVKNPNHQALSVQCKNKDSWIVDSGASSHMCNQMEAFNELKELDKEDPRGVQVGDGHIIETVKKGSITMKVEVENGTKEDCTLLKVLYVPDLNYNLLSVPEVVTHGKSVTFTAEGCTIRNKDQQVAATGLKIGNLFYLTCTVPKAVTHAHAAIVNHEKSKEDIWHSRFGHLGVENMKRLVNSDLVEGLDYNVTSEAKFCEPCTEGKIHKKKFPKTGGTRATEILELVHSDVCGKMDVPSLGGAEYFLSFVDDLSRYIWIYPIKYKSDVWEKFLEWQAMVERSTDRKLKKLRSDNGGEYLSDLFTTYFKRQGIHHQTTIRKTPEQNGVAERMNRTLEETIRAMLSESGLPKAFWAEALSTATYLRNRSPTKAVAEKTPLEAWSGEKPNVQNLRIFGCICYAHIPKDERKKLDSKARKAVFVGYGKDKKGYRLYDIATKKFFFSRDVSFNETEFITENANNVRRKDEDKGSYEITECPDEENEEAENSGRPVRSRRPPQYYGERANLVTTDIIEPKNIKGVLVSDEKENWLDAMENEIKSLKEHGVWDLVKLPEGRKTVGCKWIFKVKQDADGNVDRYKARLVAQGFSQKEGEDYDETFSPVVRFESIRTVIALAAQLGLSLHQMDVKTAFLNGELKEKIYTRQPPGYVVQGKETYVCLLYKSLYGLKQSARCWNEELDSQLKKMGFSQSAFDPCIYVRSKENEIIIIAVYVDDLIIGGEKDSSIKRIKDTISSKFDMEDMGKLHHFLGVKIVQNPSWIWIGQPAYIKVLLKNFAMENSKAVTTPFDAGAKLVKSKDDDNSCNKEKYQSAVGSLLFLSNRTRPDISYAVGVTARYSANPSDAHWSAVKRIMRYLNGSINLGLLYVREEGTGKLVGYSDADWAGDLDDRKSTSGYVFQLSGSAITWRSKKQTVVALSTAEAEYIALASAAQEAVWLKRLISDLRGSEEKTITIYEDNQSAICMGKNQQYHGRTKHVDIKYHFVREKIATGAITVPYCKTDDMVADIFTKPLFAPRFKRLCELLGMKTFTNSDN